MRQLAENFVKTLADTQLGRAINPHPVGGGASNNPLNLFNKEQISKLGNMSLNEVGKNVAFYMKGGDFGFGGTSSWYAKRRRAVFGGLAGLGVANALDINPLGLTDMANTLATLGAHGAMGYGIMGSGGRYSKAAGVGYLAATALNTFRGGDNVGPM